MQKRSFLNKFWPIHKTSQLARNNPPDRTRGANDFIYISRPRIEKAITDALDQGENLVIYGPPHQGKTMLLNRLVAVNESMYIECRPGFKRTQIYRVALSSLGYAVLVEKTKRGKVSTTINLGVAPLSAGASAEGEVEQVMQSVTVDLKNPAEVAQLISRIKDLPWLVLNNFQLLDSGTKRSLLFDLTFFTERPNIRIIIIGSWSNEDFLEEIEPALAGRFKYVQVPMWTDAELRQAAAQWSAHFKALNAITPQLDEFLTLAGGDISLFRAFVEGSIKNDDSAPAETGSSTSILPIQAIVLGRFRRGLSTKLREIFAQRDSYVTYSSLQATSSFVNNPKFKPIPNAGDSAYIRTFINPQTNQPYLDGKEVLVDRKGNPQYLQVTTGKVEQFQTDIVRFLLKKFHAVVQQGSIRIDLDTLVHDFGETLDPKPVALDESRLRAVFKRFDEVQRQAFIVPHMLAVGGTGDGMEITDRRLTLFLQSVNFEDIEELLDDVQPNTTPAARRHNHISPEMTAEEEAAYIQQATPESQEILSTAKQAQSEPVEAEESGEDEADESEEGLQKSR